MNAVNPMVRFLGLEPDADPLDTLGVGVSDLDEASIRSALKRREEQIKDHPDGESGDANEVRLHVRDAAQLLLNPIARLAIVARHMPRDLVERSRKASTSERKLTDFDREVLGILVASGGWNARSRARLMAVASQYEVSNDRLLSVLTGMASWLQDRGSKSRPASQGAGSTTLRDMVKPRVDGKTEVVFDRFVNRWMSDLRSDDPWAINRMSLLFGAIAMILFGFMFFMMMLPTAEVQPEASSASDALVARDSGVDSNLDSTASGGISEDSDLLNRQSGLPDMPSSSIDAADAMNETTGSIVSIVKELNEGVDPLGLHHGFEALIQQAGEGWFLVASREREQLLSSIFDLFDSISTDQNSLGTYIETFRFESGIFSSVQQIPESGFKSGVLSMLAGSTRQSPAVRSIAMEALGQSGESGPRAIDFSSGVLVCLESFLPRLVELMDVDGESKLRWAVWIRCIESLDRDMFEPLMAQAVDLVVRESINPAADGVSRTVLGTLLSRFEYEQSATAQEMVLGWYVDSDIPSNRREALTRLLVDLELSPRFDESIIIDPGSGVAFARLQRDALSKGWIDVPGGQFQWRSPVPDGFDPVMARIWEDTWELSQSKVMQMSDASLMQRQLEIRMLNEAASALTTGRNPAAMKLMREVEVGLQIDQAAPVLAIEEAVSLAEWSGRLARARSRDDKLEILDQLNKVPAGSFDSASAIQLSKVAYLGASAIRSRAQQIIARRFVDDPEIMIALLDSLPERPTKELNEFLETLLDRDLPEVKSKRWRSEVRRLMVERSLLLRLASTAVIDRLAGELSGSYQAEAGRLGATVLPISDMSSPLESIRLLSSIRIGRLMDSFSGSDSRVLSDLKMGHEARRRLASDAIQASLMESLFLMELLSYEWSVRLPTISGDIEMILEDLKLDLPVSSHVLEQLVLVEEAMAAVWSRVLDVFIERQLEQNGAVG